ncbi:CPBP family intramembrane glutamic endopeptidase [Occultella gossypii]|uniref:CPBP family intramembrane metalloprotease n=1 Tax=Occultella gossypii TaxID=2800820 RepID=A0ABS7SDS0_9MICO|nr:CPBP family intramembrane glutamic endopeptidase [Occultella gossypii]MBZ2198207.1 CPBP family intramembrane metalloprotease [Occultella gossypii]
MSQQTHTVPPDVPYHRVLAGERRRIGRGILAIVLLIGGLLLISIILTTAAHAVDAAIGTDGRAAYTPLVHAAGLASVAVMIPWSMLIQRWLYGVRGASLHSVISRFRFDIFGRALVLILPVWIVLLGIQYLAPVPEGTTWTNTDVIWFILATLLLTPLQAAGEEYGYRGLVFRVAGGWAHGARAGLVVGVLVSSVVFATIHFSTDVWLNVHYLIFAVGTALITWRTGGLEVAVVLHAGLNTLVFVLEAALRQDFTASADRSAGVGEVATIVGPAVVVVLVTVVVWMLTRRTGPARTPRSPAERATPELSGASAL